MKYQNKMGYTLGHDRNTLRRGDRIRLKVRTIGGFKGMGTVLEDQVSTNPLVRFQRDGDEEWQSSYCCRNECAKLKSRAGANANN